MRATDSRVPRPEEAAHAKPVEQTIRAEATEFVRRIGSLSNDPNARREMMTQTVRQVAGGLLDEFGDHYALAVHFQILSELAWRGPDGLRAAQGSEMSALGPSGVLRQPRPS